MNERADITAAAGTPLRPAPRHRRCSAALARLALAVALCGTAQAQDGLARLVSRDALVHLAHPDAEVRGEAALVVAGRPDLLQQPALLAMAKEREPAARHRAFVALGLMGSAPAVQVLAAVLADTTTRGTDDGVAAAFGLGLVADQQATAATTAVLSAIAQGSWKRQRDTLLALLIAMTMQPARGDAMAVRRLYDDESNRDPQVRGLMLSLLLQHDATFDPRLRQRVLERGSPDEQRALLGWLAGPGPTFDASALPTIERLARHAPDPLTRAAALEALTRAGHPQALDLALRCLRSDHAAECGQALRTLLALGGARMLLAFAPRVIEETDAARKTAWLTQWQAPLTTGLAEHCGQLAADPALPWSLRTAAVLLLARGHGERASPLLRDVFRGTTVTAALPALALLLRQLDAGLVPLDRLLESPTELRAHETRWVALLQADHPEAERQVLAGLRDRTGLPDSVLPALRTWRLGHVLRLPAAWAEPAPALVRGLLGAR